MNNLNDLVRRFTIAHDAKISKICAPLNDYFGVSVFVYYSIDEEGNFAILSNHPKQLEFFYDQKLYLKQPYLRHPSFFRSGCAITPTTQDLENQERCARNYHFKDLFLILQRKGVLIEGFLFATQNVIFDYLSHLDLLKRFGVYFKMETKSLIQKILYEKYSLQKALGKLFLQEDVTLPLSSHQPKTSDFLKQISPLSPRENQCLELYQQGYTSQATAALLGLSPRTVEDYFENIKLKLNCHSKLELLDL